MLESQYFKELRADEAKDSLEEIEDFFKKILIKSSSTPLLYYRLHEEHSTLYFLVDSPSTYNFIYQIFECEVSDGGGKLTILSSHLQLRTLLGRNYYINTLNIAPENRQQLLSLERFCASFEKIQPLIHHLQEIFSEHHVISLDKSSFSLISALITLVRQHPDLWNFELLHRMIPFLSQVPRGFCRARSLRTLLHLISTHHRFEIELKNAQEIQPNARYLFFKLLRAEIKGHKESERVLGIPMALNILHKYECFEQKHILKAIAQTIPGVKAVPYSFYSYYDSSKSLLFIYLEIKKMRGRTFSFQELTTLRCRLDSDLKNSIAYLSASLFVPRNEEELFRNIIQLSKELKYVRDLPQVMISFQEQSHEILKFNVIILRLVQGFPTSLESLCHLLPASIKMTFDRVERVGSLRKQYFKEANVLTLDVESSLFLRRNHAIDLVNARHYVGQALEQMIGKFRDYNGGFLLKQSEQLESIRQLLGEEGKQHAFLLENLFYALTPRIMQALLLPETGTLLFELCLYMLDQKLPAKKNYSIETRRMKRALCVAVKTSERAIKEKVSHKLKYLQLGSSKFAYAALEIDGFYYFFYLEQHPTNLQLLYAIEEGLSEDEKSLPSASDHRILKINFQEGDLSSLNPHIGLDLRCLSIVQALFEGLMRTNPAGYPEPAAAERVTISACKTIYTFYLRDQRWSNGEKVTAQHFINTWKKAIAPYSRCLRAELFFPIKNAYEARHGTLPLSAIGLIALDQKTLVIELEHPTPYFLDLVASPLFAPLYGEAEEPTVFNGPFIISCWERDRYFRLTRNPYYWDVKHVALQGIEIYMVKNYAGALHLYDQNKLDWLGDPFSPLSSETAHLRQAEVKSKQAARIYWVNCNANQFPLTSSTLRRAMSYALNRKVLTEEILYKQTPTNTPLPSSFSLLNPNPQENEENVTLARSLFEQALKELGLTREEFPTLTFTHAEMGPDKKISQFLKESWEKVLGISIKLVQCDWNTLLYLLDRREFQMAGGLRSALYNDPKYFLEFFKEQNYLSNFSGWENDQYKELLNVADQCVDPAERLQCLKEAEELLVEHMPVIPLYAQTYHYIARDNNSNISISDLGYIDFKHTSTQNSFIETEFFPSKNDSEGECP